MSVALAGIERSGLKLGDPLLIWYVYPRLLSDLCSHPYNDSGAGPIGLVTLLAAKAAGATPIVLTDLSESRLAFAKTLVPDVRTIVVDRSSTPKELAEKIKETAKAKEGLNCAIECSGVESSIQAAIFVSENLLVPCRNYMLMGLGFDTVG